MDLKIQQTANIMSGEISPASSAHEDASAGLQSFCVKEESLVLQDTDGSTGISPVPPSEFPVDSFTVGTSLTVSQPQYKERSVSTLPKLQSAETKIKAASCQSVYFQS